MSHIEHLGLKIQTCMLQYAPPLTIDLDELFAPSRLAPKLKKI